MDVIVSSRKTELPDNLRRIAEEKIGRLSRFVDGMDRAEVHFFEENNPRIADKEVCEVTMQGHGHHVRCKVSAPDGYAAIDLAVEKLEHQLHRLSSKLKSHQKGAGRQAPPDALVEVPDPAEVEAAREANQYDPPKIVKSKRFAMMPMTPEEAMQRMELLGHGFFFFTNIDTHRAAVVYRRDDGDVGLIDEDG